MKKVAIVILNWNGKLFLERFLSLLIERTPDAEIVVADNASSDDSVIFIEKNFPEIRLIKNDKNYGYAEGYNKALSQISAKYYVLLNSDVEVSSDWLAPLLKVLDENEDIVVCQPKILNYYQRNYFEYAGASGGFIDKLGYPFCRGRLFNTIEEDKGQYDDIIDVFWVSGACFAVRSEIFHALGGFDADFFAHMEEIDFCWKIHNNEKRVVVVPESKVFHIGGGTLPKKSWKKTYLNFRNNYLLLYKNLPGNKIYTVLTIRLFFDWLAALKFLSEFNIFDCFAVFKAQLNTYFFLHKHKYKRKFNTSFSFKHIYNKSIIFDYYIKRKRKFTNLEHEKFITNYYI